MPTVWPFCLFFPTCHPYRHALARVPRQFRDVVLVNFGGLLYKTGHVDDAMLMLRDALAVDDRQPETNFMVGGMYNVKGNLTGAIFHFRQALRMDPGFDEAIRLLTPPSCVVRKIVRERLEREAAR